MQSLTRTMCLLLLSLVLLAVDPPAHAQERPADSPARSGGEVTSPSDHLGRPLGVDFDLADWQEVSSYYRLLAEQSPHVLTEKVGETTEGRDFLIMIISSQENLANLEQIRQHARTIADPRQKSEEEIAQAISEGRPIVFVSCQMHSTETAGSQFSMQLAHTLATSDQEPWKSARENLVLVVFTTNPDGVDHVTEWYREHVGTAYEAAGLLKLYQLYTGHDNNRDWFMLTQKETQIVTELLYREWFPTVYWDVHQQNSNAERMFVPPYRDPLNPNLDAGIVTAINSIGSRAVMDMTRAGLTGISTGVRYDMWWNGGNRSVPVRHNIIGILTEAASVEIASPVFLPHDRLRAPAGLPGYHPSNQFPSPWPGGWWRLRDIIDYEMAFADSLLASLNREPQTWLRNAHEAAARAITGDESGVPRAWIIPSDNPDPDAVRRLVDVLIASGIEVHVSPEAIEADGREYPAGSIVIHRAQPYAAHVKDLFDVQRYPDGPPPYDVAGWTLPYLLGVRRIEVIGALGDDVQTERAETADDATRAFSGDPRLDDAGEGALSSRHSRTWTTLAASLAEGDAWTFHTRGERAGLFVRSAEEAEEREDSPTDAEGAVVLSRMPRIGLYTPWSGSMDEGWMRWMLDTWDVPYVTVRNEMLRAGNLDDFIDVLIIPNVTPAVLNTGRAPGTIPEEFARGLDPEGSVAIDQFVREGGTLITMGGASRWAIDLFELPLTDVTRLEANKEFSCPGSVLRSMPAEGSRFTAGLPGSLPLFFASSAAWREATDKERETRHLPPRAEQRLSMQPLLRYAPERVLLSGWIRQPQVIEHRYAWVRCEVGRGAVHVFAFSPHYRGWSQGTFPLIFRAALLEEGER